MLKRHGLIYQENPALLEALRTHLCTQLFQATTAELNRQFTIASGEWGAGIPRLQPPPPTKQQTSKNRPGGQRFVFCSHSALSSCVVSFPFLTCWDELGFFSQLKVSDAWSIVTWATPMIPEDSGRSIRSSSGVMKKPGLWQEPGPCALTVRQSRVYSSQISTGSQQLPTGCCSHVKLSTHDPAHLLGFFRNPFFFLTLHSGIPLDRLSNGRDMPAWNIVSSVRPMSTPLMLLDPGLR